MRMKHFVVTGMALTTLFGCGMNANESINDRDMGQIENVRHQPNQQQSSDNGMNQHPGVPGEGINRNQDNPNLGGGSIAGDGRTLQERQGNLTRRNDGDNQSNQTREDRQQTEQPDRANQQGDYRVAEKIADDVNSNVDEIDGAYVLTMGDNAYVACHLDNDDASGKNGDLSDELEKKVTKAVKDSDHQIDNVYVSSNPDFIDLTSNYMEDIERGEPIEGFFDQFTEMIERVFPTRNR